MVIHALILPISCLNIAHKDFKLSLAKSVVLWTVYLTSYVIWVLHVYSVSNKWAYPLIDEIVDRSGRICLWGASGHNRCRNRNPATRILLQQANLCKWEE